MYSQYEYYADIWEYEQHVKAKFDFGIITQGYKMLKVTEDKAMKNANYSNSWEEEQVLGELFVAVYETVRNYENVIYPINIFTIRAVGTKFTKFLIENIYFNIFSLSLLLYIP